MERNGSVLRWTENFYLFSVSNNVRLCTCATAFLIVTAWMLETNQCWGEQRKRTVPPFVLLKWVVEFACESLFFLSGSVDVRCEIVYAADYCIPEHYSMYARLSLYRPLVGGLHYLVNCSTIWMWWIEIRAPFGHFLNTACGSYYPGFPLNNSRGCYVLYLCIVICTIWK